VNAEFSTIAGISNAIPFLAPLFPAVVGADLLMLTKNQVFMILRLAAIYGDDPGFFRHGKEIASVVGGAFGWRTLARELSGVLPGPLGLPLRIGISYSGTYTVGKAAEMVFDRGRRPTRKEMRQIYEDASRLAKETVARLAPSLRRKEMGEGHAALPEPHEAALPEEVGLGAAVPEPAGRPAEPGE
jgi:uncharacterized protein (DUF697 family)